MWLDYMDISRTACIRNTSSTCHDNVKTASPLLCRCTLHGTGQGTILGKMMYSLLACLALAGSSFLAAADAVKPIQTAHRMPREEARQKRPITVEGHLISIIHESPAGLWRGVVMDATDSCYFLMPGPPSLDLRFGKKIRLSGVTNHGLYAPCIIGSSAVVLEPAPPLPEPRSVGYAELDSGLLDCAWVRVAGVARRAETLVSVTPPTQQLTLDVEGRLLRALVYTASSLSHLEDCAVTLKATVNQVFGNQGEQYVPMLWVAEEQHIRIDSPRPSEGPPATTVPELFTWDHQRDWRHAVALRGVVTAQFEPGRFYMTGDGAGVLVSLKEIASLKVGTLVTVHGYPQRSPGQRELADATIAQQQAGPSLEPTRIASEASMLANAGNLAYLRGRVEAVEAATDSLAFLISTEPGSPPIRAALARLPGAEGLPEVLPGAEVQATGICQVAFTDLRRYIRDRAPDQLALQMRSPADLLVVRQGLWWRSKWLPWWVGCLGGLVALTMAAMWLRQRRKMGRARAAQERIDAVTQERHRIAREVHDSLAQSLTAISMQLETARAAFDIDPQKAQPHVLLAREASSAALRDARQAVWSMHSQALEECPLPEAIRRVAEQLSIPGGAVIGGQTLGTWEPLAPLIEHALLRASQEALTNAVRHAKATSITWFLLYRAGSVRLEVSDNGCGFPENEPTPSQRGGFGLLGLRERISSLGGELELHSEPGQGARVTVTFTISHTKEP
jgi:signal transduction histidine kinase